MTKHEFTIQYVLNRARTIQHNDIYNGVTWVEEARRAWEKIEEIPNYTRNLNNN